MKIGYYIIDFCGGLIVEALIEYMKGIDMHLGILFGCIIVIGDLMYYYRTGEQIIDKLTEFL